MRFQNRSAQVSISEQEYIAVELAAYVARNTGKLRSALPLEGLAKRIRQALDGSGGRVFVQSASAGSQGAENDGASLKSNGNAA